MSDLSLSTPKVNLLGLHRKAMEDFFQSLHEKPYRALQILKWVHYHGVADLQAMTNLSKSLRNLLLEHAEIVLPTILVAKEATDGTYKWLLKLHDGNCIETVFIPEKTRGTLCISSQVGCILNCDFCSTGKQGFNRNLTTAEIMSQVWIAIRHLSKQAGVHDHTVTNIVLMGMGEPLLNLPNLIPALHLLLDDFAYGLSKRRVTVSTAGVIPAMYALRQASDVALAVSLHAPNDALRNQLVPLNKKYPLASLIEACKDYFKQDKRRYVTLEYVMLAGINDTPLHAKELITLITDLRAKVNLIPFNPFPKTSYQRSDKETIDRFQKQLLAAGINTIIRRTRGEDIDAACGQLVGQVTDRTKRAERWQKSNLI